jgi:phosphoglycolate phosphatase-like HAD superfamily hydrolase
VSLNLLVLFDVDGTLLLSHDELYVQANADALREVYGVTGVRHPDDPGDTALHYTRLVLEAAGFDRAQIDEGLERWCAAISRRYVELLTRADTDDWKIAPGAAAILARIPHRALLTGNPEAIARARLQRMGLAEFFAEEEGAYGCERERRTALIDLALARAGDWTADRSVAVGDTPRDIHTAREAGARCIAVATGAFDREQLAAADRVIDALAELPNALASLD